jgi:hypothetical protein
MNRLATISTDARLARPMVHVTITAPRVGTTLMLRIPHRQRFIPFAVQRPRPDTIYPLLLTPGLRDLLRRAILRRVRAVGAVVVRADGRITRATDARPLALHHSHGGDRVTPSSSS